MRQIRSRGTPAKRRLRDRRTAQLSRWEISACLAALAGAVFWLKRPSPEGPLDRYEQAGAIYRMGPPQSAWSLFSQAVFGVRPAENAVAKLHVGERAILAFVPRALALVARPAAGGRPEPRVATALVAIAESRNASAPRHAWLRSLPRQFAFSQSFSADCRAVMGAGFARGLLEDHERLVQDLLSLRPPLLAERPVTREEALWGLGLVTHLGLGEGAPLAPGLLDGVLRHWGEDRCAELVPDVAPDDRRESGWALVARRAIAPGEPVRLCSPGGAPNAELLASFGVAYPDNPFGPSLLQGTTSLAAELRDAALEAACDPAAVVQLRLHRDDGAVLTEEAVRCGSLVWLGDDAPAAMAAGYFRTWPRREAISDDAWLEAEASFYGRLRDGCADGARALNAMGGSAELARCRADAGDRFSRLVVTVRGEDQALYEACGKWALGRLERLQPGGTNTAFGA